ncbi:hypothetical protein ACIP88_15255 [Streptomyces uncialis]|uniref:hypothetical protein n=1 Tax=Streptomyces uncialis TaxID=1048205 RepID=UPI003810BF4F
MITKNGKSGGSGERRTPRARGDHGEDPAATARTERPARRQRATRAARTERVWSERELRLVDRLATVHGELDELHKERAALIAYVSRLHAGCVSAPDPAGRRTVHVDTAVGRLSWRIAADDAELVSDPEPGAGGRTAGAAGTRRDTVTRLAFLHLHRRPNRPARLDRGASPATGAPVTDSA